MNSSPTPAATLGEGASGWDRAAIAGLATIAFALSYNAQRQMAEAAQVAAPLDLFFPILVDGFIAYGIRALVVTRTRSSGVRAYVWALFASATAASIWANWLHAVRLNQRAAEDLGARDRQLHLGDTAVGALSVFAPLALAGAVHLYLVINRPVDEAADNGERQNPASLPDPAPEPASSRVRSLASDDVAREHPLPDADAGPARGLVPEQPLAPRSTPDTAVSGATAVSESCPAPDTRLPEPAADADTQHARTDPTVRRPGTTVDRAPRPQSVSDEDLLAIARSIDRPNRQAIRDAVTARGQTVSTERVAEVLRALKPRP
jgi:hypothetical protein